MDPSTATAYSTPDIARLLTLFASHVREHGYQAPGSAAVESFLAAPGPAVLVFVEDPRRMPECWDVAVILPDVLRECAPGVRVGLLDPQTSRSLAARFGVCQWPSLVFLRDGGYLGAISRMRDWEDYRSLIPALLKLEVSEPPSIQAVAPARTH